MGIHKALLAAALMAAVAAAPAQATVSDHEAVTQDYTDSYDCGFPVAVSGTMNDLFVLRDGKRDNDGGFAVLDRLNYTETHTNTLTGESFTITGNDVFHDVHMTRVEGNIFDFRAIDAGQSTVRDSDGNVVQRQSGSVHTIYRVDVGDDDVFGGTFIEWVDVWLAGPHPGFDADICDIATELIG